MNRKQNIKYSVVTANFNGFSLMQKYFASLEAQTYGEFEVIVVDDCSTDNSYQELQDYAKASTMHITVLQSKRNAGPGNARNIGMDAAKGEWITFIDNDDWVVPTFFEEINEVIAKGTVNCIIFDYIIKKKQNESVAKSMYRGSMGAVSTSDCIRNVRNHTFGKFYQLERIRSRNIRFPNIRRCEDVAFVCRAIEACGNAYYYAKPLYYYWQRSASLSNNKNMSEEDMIKAFRIVEDSLLFQYPKEVKEKSITDLLYGAVLMMCKAGKPDTYIKDYIDTYENKYTNWEQCEILADLGKVKGVFLKLIQKRAIKRLKALAWLHSRMVG